MLLTHHNPLFSNVRHSRSISSFTYSCLPIPYPLFCHHNHILMSFYTCVLPTSLVNPCCKHMEVTHCLDSFRINHKSPFSPPPWFPQSDDSFPSFRLPYNQRQTMSFNFSNIGNQSFTPPAAANHSFTPPAATNHSSFSVQSRPIPPPSHTVNNSNIDPNILADEAVPTQFINTLVNQFNFGDGDQDLRQNLHGFAKVIYKCVVYQY